MKTFMNNGGSYPLSNTINEEVAQAINTLGQFCGVRSITSPDRKNLMEKYGYEQADVFVLFGGSILSGGDVLAQAIRDQAAKTFVIVGGEGPTTETLRETMLKEYAGIETKGLSEAEIFQR